MEYGVFLFFAGWVLVMTLFVILLIPGMAACMAVAFGG
jgi:hypothetical protein